MFSTKFMASLLICHLVYKLLQYKHLSVRHFHRQSLFDPRSLLMEKFVIENGRSQAGIIRGFRSFLGTDNSCLAENGAVLLAGDLFRHLEHHFHKSVVGQTLRSLEQNSRLTEVRDDAFRLGTPDKPIIQRVSKLA